MKKNNLILAGLLSIASLSLVSCGDDTNTSCPVGYEGKNCDTEMREKFLGNWTASDVKTDGGQTFNYVGVITKGSATNAVNIGNSFREGFFERSFGATVDGNTLTVPSQSPDKDGYFVEGSAIFSSNELSWNYYIVDDSTNNQVVHTGIWTK